MSKAHQYIIKAAALRAQADKLEKVAVLVGGSDEVTGSDLGIGAGALGLLGGGAGALGINELMRHRAAEAAIADTAAQNSKLLKGLGLGALGLGGIGGIGYGLSRLADSANNLDTMVRILSRNQRF